MKGKSHALSSTQQSEVKSARSWAKHDAEDTALLNLHAPTLKARIKVIDGCDTGSVCEIYRVSHLRNDMLCVESASRSKSTRCPGSHASWQIQKGHVAQAIIVWSLVVAQLSHYCVGYEWTT